MQDVPRLMLQLQVILEAILSEKCCIINLGTIQELWVGEIGVSAEMCKCRCSTARWNAGPYCS
jgi:hypothetical protein